MRACIEIIFAALDGEVAVPCNLQPAVAGSNSWTEGMPCGVWPGKVAKKSGSCATRGPEPCQVREEAALRDLSCVPQGSLDGVNCPGNAWKVSFEARCAALN